MNETEALIKYEKIISLPHKISSKHNPMPPIGRATQFAPFAALTGYGDCITEAGRLTDQMDDRDADRLNELNARLLFLQEQQPEEPIEVAYFQEDGKKSGGAYVTCTGVFKMIDESERTLLLKSGVAIPLDRISALSGSIFPLPDRQP